MHNSGGHSGGLALQMRLRCRQYRRHTVQCTKLLRHTKHQKGELLSYGSYFIAGCENSW